MKKSMTRERGFERGIGPGALLVILLLLGAQCVTEIPGGRPNPPHPDPEKDKKWVYGEIPIRPGWTDIDRRVPVILASLPRNAPVRYRLENLPEPGDQRPQASGTAWAAGYVAGSYFFQSKRKAIGYHCSPAFLYNQLNGGNDAGVGIRDALRMMQEIGCSREELMPYRPYDYKYSPGEEALRDAALYRIDGFGRVDYTDLNQVKAHILQGSVVVATMLVFENFITLRDQEWSGPVGATMGLQTIAVVGYDDQKEQFLIENSAGKKWGKDGYATVPYSWFIRLVRQAYVLW